MESLLRQAPVQREWTSPGLGNALRNLGAVTHVPENSVPTEIGPASENLFCHQRSLSAKRLQSPSTPPPPYERFAPSQMQRLPALESPRRAVQDRQADVGAIVSAGFVLPEVYKAAPATTR